MGGKASKDTQGLVPRDGTDEIEIQPKKLVTQEQFDELRHKFQLLEQLMQQDKGKLSDLENSLTQYQLDKKELRKSFIEIDSEVRKDKEGREGLEQNLARLVEERTREKYKLLDNMLSSQEERLNQLKREQNERSDRLEVECDQLDRKLTSSLQVERGEYEKLLESKMREEGSGDLDKRVSKLLDEKVSPLPNLLQELEARKRETEEVRESIQKEKKELLNQINKVQQSMLESKQSGVADGNSELAEKLSVTKDDLISRLNEEQSARGQLESVLRTLLDNRVDEEQKKLFERIKEKEDLIQAEVQKMQHLEGRINQMEAGQDKTVKELENKLNQASTEYQQKLGQKEMEKRELARKISETFEHRLTEVHDSFSQDMSKQLIKAETIREESDLEKTFLNKNLENLKEEVQQQLKGFEESQTNFEESIQSLRAQVTNQNGESDQSSRRCEQIETDLSAVRSEVSAVRTQVREELGKISDEIDGKTEVFLEARLSEVLPSLTERMGRAEANCEDLGRKLGSVNSAVPESDSAQQELYQKTDENVNFLLDKMELSRSDIDSVNFRLSEMDSRQLGCESQLTETEKQLSESERQLSAIQSESEKLRNENKEMRAKFEAQGSELARLSEENSKLRESVDSLMKSRDEQTAVIESIRNPPSQSSGDIPPESPLEKMEEMETILKKQGHGMNDMEFLIDEAKELAKNTSEKVETFEAMFERDSVTLREEFEALKAQLANNPSGISANQKAAPQGASNPFGDSFA